MGQKRKHTLNNHEVTVLSALFARSNMGMAPAPVNIVGQLRGTPTITLESAIMLTCQEFMETEEHQRIFMEEGRSWFKDLKKRTRADVERIWPHQARALWGN